MVKFEDIFPKKNNNFCTYIYPKAHVHLPFGRCLREKVQK